MPIIPEPMTKEALAKSDKLPEKYKEALEKAIAGWSIPDDPEDAVWPDYFRGDVVTTEAGNELSEDDELSPQEYETECVWFQAGWKARDRKK